ncbi:hypothetical protein [Actinomadura opuntiae]|uniref:hypothetical protein n=1 Tax=Actinomadura sp. OS1-43 TaxID=604315 RepID=UPI00255B2292|nr:hypothetical protein [Actinomadura sp. OS1-43]MDL4814977.1 hypothetical protein [Actinomadura sp. OS1-43]
MTPEEIERDLSEAVDARLAERLEQVRQQRANRRARALRHQKRRKAGMRARHHNKLNHLAQEDK